MKDNIKIHILYQLQLISIIYAAHRVIIESKCFSPIKILISRLHFKNIFICLKCSLFTNYKKSYSIALISNKFFSILFYIFLFILKLLYKKKSNKVIRRWMSPENRFFDKFIRLAHNFFNKISFTLIPYYFYMIDESRKVKPFDTLKWVSNVCNIN